MVNSIQSSCYLPENNKVDTLLPVKDSVTLDDQFSKDSEDVGYRRYWVVYS